MTGTTNARLILLPGLAGTAHLFEPFVRAIPPEMRWQIIEYPTDRRLSYAQLLSYIESRLADERARGEDDRRVVLLAESFAGPLGVMYAAKHPAHVAAVVLVATFVTPPMPPASPVLHHLLQAIFCLPAPCWAIRLALAGAAAPQSICRAARDAVRAVDPDVLAYRVEQTTGINASNDLRQCRAPLLVLRAADDVLVPRDCHEEILAIRPDAEVCIIRSPHMILQVQPQIALREITDFLTRFLSR